MRSAENALMIKARERLTTEMGVGMVRRIDRANAERIGQEAAWGLTEKEGLSASDEMEKLLNVNRLTVSINDFR